MKRVTWCRRVQASEVKFYHHAYPRAVVMVKAGAAAIPLARAGGFERRPALSTVAAAIRAAGACAELASVAGVHVS
jgi:hypothetical protein